jgi:hypothetical protein
VNLAPRTPWLGAMSEVLAGPDDARRAQALGRGVQLKVAFGSDALRNYLCDNKSFGLSNELFCAPLSPGSRHPARAYPGGWRMGEDRDRQPLARRVPGATRAKPESEHPGPPKLPEDFLQHVRAVVAAVHAEAAAEQAAGKEHAAVPNRAEPSRGLPRRVPGASGRSKPKNGFAPPVLPAGWPRRLSEEDAESDRAAMPPLTASGSVASAPVGKSGTRPDHAEQQERAAGQDRLSWYKRSAERDRTAQRVRGAQQKRAAKQDRQRAAEQKRAEQQERERAAEERARREQQAARQERERAAKERARQEQERQVQERQDSERARRERAEQERARRERAEQERARRERAEQERARRELAEQEPARPDRLRQAHDRRVAAAVPAPADLQMQPQLRGPGAQGFWSSRAARLMAAALALVIAGSLGFTLLRGTGAGSGSPAANAPQARAAAIQDEAAAWVAQQVNPAYTVSCDSTMCRALQAHGFANVLVLRPTARDLLGAEVVVATADIRRQFGTLLGSAYAPAVMASFGAGNVRIDIREIYAYGAAAYQSALKADLQQRKIAAGDLLRFGRVSASAAVRGQITSGRVDSRLLIVLSDMAASYPVDILALGDSGPGASADVPLRSVTLAQSGGVTKASLLDLLRVGLPRQFLPEYVETVEQDGRPALLIEFSAPSPLGVFNTTTP